MLLSFYQAKFTSGKCLSLSVTLYRNKNFFPRNYDLLMPSNFHLLLKLQVLVFAYKETLIVSIFFCPSPPSPTPTPLPHSISNWLAIVGVKFYTGRFGSLLLLYIYCILPFYDFCLFLYTCL